MIDKQLQNAIGLLVAGNFTGHLEQAGEASDFVDTKVISANAPKGLIPFYIPAKLDTNFLNTFPLSTDTLVLPSEEKGIDVQIEPEIVLLCDIQYTQTNTVEKITPKSFGVFNDASIRNKDVLKISYKKNWGAASQGISSKFIKIDDFSQSGNINKYRLTSFLKRDSQINQYGEDSYINTYSYFFDLLLEWVVEKMNNQKDTGPLENISSLMKESGFPDQLVLSVGATRYTEYGEETYLQNGDILYVVAYNYEKYSQEDVLEKVKEDGFLDSDDIVVLRQIVVE